MCFYSILLGLVFRWPFLEDAVQEIQLDWMVSKKSLKKSKFPKAQVLTSTIKPKSIGFVCFVHCKYIRGNFYSF